MAPPCEHGIRLPEVCEGCRCRTRQSRPVHPIAQGDKDLHLVAEVALRIQLPLGSIELLEGIGAGLEPELAVDGEKGNRQNHAAERSPEPFRAWTDERHPVGIDEFHVRCLAPDNRWADDMAPRQCCTSATR